MGLSGVQLRMPQPAPSTSRFTLAARALTVSCGVFVAAFVPQPVFAQGAGPDRVSVESLSSETISERTLENLLAWGRLHAFLVHFNPSEWAWTTDMNAYLRDGFDRVARRRNLPLS